MPDRREEPDVVLPNLCEPHFVALMTSLDVDGDETGATEVTIAQSLLVLWAITDERIVKRCDYRVADLTIVLAELGCLACYDADGFARAIRVLRKGYEHAYRVMQESIIDPDFPIAERGAAAGTLHKGV